MAKNDIDIRVGLKEEASKPLKRLSQDVKSFADEFKEATPHVEGLTASILRFGTGVAVGNLAVLAARKILRNLSTQFGDTIKAANELQSTMIGLSSVAAAFGEDQDRARESARALADDGLMSVKEAGEGLKNLLATGFNMDQAINLMNAFKDSAAFNRQGTLEFGQAIVGATQGIKNQNSIMVDNAGITKNLSNILQEAGRSANDLGLVTSDAAVRLDLYNGIMREAAVFQGDAARAAMTLQGAQSQLKVAVFNLQAQIGQALAPALEFMIASMIDGTNAARQGLQPALEGIAKAGVWVVGVVKEMALIVKTILQPVFQMARVTVLNFVESIRGLAKVVNELIHGRFKSAWDTWIDSSKKMAENSKVSISAIVKNFKDFIPESTRIAEQLGFRLDRINREGLSGFLNVVKEKMSEMPTIMSKAAKKMAEQLRKETSRFVKSMAQLVKNFNDSMRDLIVAHKDKVSEIKKQIADETKSFEKEADKIRKNHEDEIKQFKDAMRERLTSLQVQLDREKAKGKNANEEKIALLEEMIRKEKIALEDQLAIKEGLIEDEINTAKEKHNEKLNELQTELDVEMELQKKYEEEFAKFKDAVAENDIARLKRKFAEQKALMIQEHQERLAEIRKEVQEEIAVRAGASVSGDGGGGGVVGGREPTFEEAYPVIYKGWGETEARADFAVTGGRNKAGYQELKNRINSYQHGGIVDKPTLAMIGEAGSEAILPLDKPRRMQEILSKIGLGEKSITINAPITVVKSETDIDILVERLAFQISKSGMI